MAFTVTSLGTVSSTGTTAVITTSVDCPPGSALVIHSSEAGVTISSVGTIALSVGGIPNLQKSSALNNSNASGWGGVWTIDNTSVDIPAGTTITYTKASSSSSSKATVGAYFISGTDGNAPAVNATATTGNSTTPSIGPITVTSGQLVLGFMSSNWASTSFTVTEPSGWTDAYPVVNGSLNVSALCSGYQTASSTSITYNPTLSGVSRPWAAFLLAYNPVGSGPPPYGGMGPNDVMIILDKTSTSPWVTPANFGSFKSVGTLAAAGSGCAQIGGAGVACTGGTGAAWSSSLGSDLTGLGTITPGVTSFPFVVGVGGLGVTKTSTSGGVNGNPGTDTCFNATSLANAVSNGITKSVAAEAGKGGIFVTSGSAITSPTGGQAANGVGTTKFSGGRAGNVTGGGRVATGGGGAAGPNGDGQSGVDTATASTTTAGGAGDNGLGGAGSAAVGAGLTSNPGGAGTEFDASHGCGGGSGAAGPTGTSTNKSGDGGPYGGATGAALGGGGTNTSGNAGDGLIVIIYTKAAAVTNLTFNMTSSQIVKVPRSVNKKTALTSTAIVVIIKAVTKTTNFTSPQSITSVKSVSKTISTMFSSQLASLSKLASKNLSISLVSPELVTAVKANAKNVLLSTSELLTLPRSIFKRITMTSPEVMAFSVQGSHPRQFSLTSSQLLTTGRSTSKIIGLLSPEIITHATVISRTISFVTGESLRAIRQFVKIMYLTNGQNLFASAIKGGRIVASWTQQQTISIERSINITKIITHSQAFVLQKGAQIHKAIDMYASQVLYFFYDVDRTVATDVELDMTTGQTVTFDMQHVGGILVINFTQSQVFQIVGRDVSKFIALVSPMTLMFSRLPTKVISLSNSEALRVIKNMPKRIATVLNPQRVTAWRQMPRLFSFHTTVTTTFQLFRPATIRVFHFANSQVVTIKHRARHIILMVSPQQITVSQYISKTINFVSRSVVALTIGSRGLFTLDPIGQIVRVTKSTRRIIPLLTSMRISITRSIDRTIAYSQSQAITLIQTTQVSKLIALATHVRVSLQQSASRILTGGVSQVITVARATSRTIFLRTHQRLRHILGFVLTGRVAQIVTLRKAPNMTFLMTQAQFIPKVVFNSFTFLMTSPQTITVRKATSKTVNLIRTRSKLVVSKAHEKFVGFITSSIVTAIRGIPKHINFQTHVIARLTKSTSRVFNFITLQRLKLVKVIHKILIGTIGQKIIVGRLWYVVVHMTTPVTTVMTKTYVKTISFVTSSAVWIYVKVRTLIQRAVILLVGA